MGENSTYTPPADGAAFEGSAPPASSEENLILGKFKSQEDLTAAYQELEKKLGQGGAPSKEEPAAGADKPEQKPEDKPAEGAEEKKPEGEEAPEYEAPLVKTDEDRAYEKEAYGEALATLFDNAGIHAKSVADYFYAHNKFPEQAYEALAAQGINRATVDQYLRGGMAAVEASSKEKEAEAVLNRESEKKIMDSVGGQEKYQLMVQWAATNMSKEDVESFNKVMDSGDQAAITWAVRGLAQRYTKAMGSDPKLVRGGAPAGDSSVFLTWEDVTIAMSDPRYKESPAYRAEVAQKVSRSPALNRRK